MNFIKKSPIIKVAQKTCPAVITIVATKDLLKAEGTYFFQKENIKVGGGSGFIISKDGYVLTCNHVVSDSDAKYTVIIDPKHTYEAKILARDPLVDLAILKIEGKNFPNIKLGDSSKIQLGEKVVAIGNPLGDFDDTLSAGIISGLSRKINARSCDSAKTTSLRGLIQTDAAINPGNSGGPLINMACEVIGINTAMALDAQNIGFAIPINYAKDDLKELKNNGKLQKPFLGIRYLILNKDISFAQKLPVDYGALILRECLGEDAVIKNSACHKAGLKEYDIILEAEGQKITEENTITDIISKYKVGDTLPLTILRNKKQLKLKIIIESKK